MDMDCAEEIAAHCPAPSLVPRLHCIVARHLPHTNPMLPVDDASKLGNKFSSFSLNCALIDAEVTNITIFVVLNNIVDKPALIRSQLISMLTECIGGDALAAEYILLHLLSRVCVILDIVPFDMIKLYINLYLLNDRSIYSNYRHDVVPVGKFSINLAGCSVGSAYITQLYQAIEALMPKVKIMVPSSIRALGSIILSETVMI